MMEIRYVEWLDSQGSGRWEDLDELRKMRPSICQTVGFVLVDSEDFVTLVQSLDPPTDWNKVDNGDNTICIPKFAITKSEVVRAAT